MATHIQLHPCSPTKAHTSATATTSSMATTSSSTSAPFIEPQCAIQPRRLKDFLQDQNLPFPRSRRSTISVILHAAVSSVRSSAMLRRSISRRFSGRNRSTSRTPEVTMERTTSVTVKDILRWRSFRDLVDPVESNAPPLPESESPVESESPRCTTTTSTTSSGGSPRSSWCDSDFTAGDSPVGFRRFSGEKSFHINTAGGERNTRDLKDRIVLVEEDEQQQLSPISVLDFTHKHEENFSPFHQILEDIERRNMKLKQRIQNFESLIEVNDVNKHVELNDTESFEIEEHAIRLMDHVKTSSSIEEWDLSFDCLLLDYFRDELITSKDMNNNGRLESRVLSAAKCWVNGEDDGSLEWEIEGAREACIGEMDKRWNSKDFEDDKRGIVVEIEKVMLNHLLDELLVDIVNV